MQSDPRVNSPVELSTLPQLQRGNFLKQFWLTNLEVFQRDTLALVGLIIMIVLIIVAVFAPAIAPYDPLDPIVGDDGLWLSNKKPSQEFLLGTTNLGRDVFSQLVYGTRPALVVGFTAAVGVAAATQAGQNLLERLLALPYDHPDLRASGQALLDGTMPPAINIKWRVTEAVGAKTIRAEITWKTGGRRNRMEMTAVKRR